MEVKLYDIAEAVSKLEELADNDVEMVEYLNSAKLQMNVKVDNIVKFRLNMLASSVAIDTEIKRLANMKKQRENLAERLKEYLSTVMQKNGIEKIETSIAKLSFLKSTTLDIIDEKLIPKKFIITKITKQADKTAIKQALKEGKKVAGVALTPHNNLQIK